MLSICLEPSRTRLPRLNVDNGTLYVDPTNNRVGIGITAPTAALHLGSDAGTAASGVVLGASGDVTLYRSAADVLKTDDALQVAVGLSLLSDSGAAANGIAFGSVGDVAIYRIGSRDMMVSGRWRSIVALAANTALGTIVDGDTNSRLTIGGDGKLSWGPGNASTDVTLYRSAADVLKTDDALHVAVGLSLLSDAATAASGIRFGSAADAALYRSAASTLLVNALLVVSPPTAAITNVTSSALWVGGAWSQNNTTDYNPKGLLIAPTFTFTDVGAASYPYGLLVSPTISVAAAKTLVAVYTTATQMTKAGDGTVSTGVGHYLNFTIAAGAITNGFGVQVGAPSISGGTITSNYAIRVENQGAAGVTNAYGISIVAQSGASGLNVAASLGGGTTANLWLNSNTASIAGGIAFGTGRDVTLYRSAADVLKTDDQFHAAGGITTSTKAGAPSDADTALDADGSIILDSTNHRLYVRSGGVWKYAALT